MQSLARSLGLIESHRFCVCLLSQSQISKQYSTKGGCAKTIYICKEHKYDHRKRYKTKTDCVSAVKTWLMRKGTTRKRKRKPQSETCTTSVTPPPSARAHRSSSGRKSQVCDNVFICCACYYYVNFFCV